MDVLHCENSQKLVSSLREFIAGSSKSSQKDPLELAETALYLLNTLPSARDAALEHFCTLFHYSVTTYFSGFQKNELEKKEKEEQEGSSIIQEIHKVLCNFVISHPEAWAAAISEWSLDLLGQISIRNGAAHKNFTLSDRLQLWMACQSARTLIEINMQCLQCLMDSNTDSCISDLLDKSVLYSPYFDWVVAHVGSCFPQTVINKVLYCGLKDFCVNEQGSKTPKLNSVVGILAHLANTHFNDIRMALHNLFMWSLVEYTGKTGIEDKNITLQRAATVPFLLQICSLSPVLLKALSENTVQALNIKLLMMLCPLASGWWCYFEGGQRAMLDLIVHLMLNLENSICQFIPLLFEIATLNEPEFLSVSQTAQELIELLMGEIDLRLRVSDSVPPFIRCIPAELPSLYPLLLSENKTKLSYVTRFFSVIGYHNNNVVSSCIAYLLACGSTDINFTGLEDLISGLNDNNFFGNSLSLSLDNYKVGNIPNENASLLNIWQNSNKLLKWEQKFGIICKPILHGLMNNLCMLIENLRNSSNEIPVLYAVASTIYQLLTISHRQLSITETFTLTEASVIYFFACIANGDGNTTKFKHSEVANKLLFKLCSSSIIARLFAIRLILETILEAPTSSLFGATVKSDPVVDVNSLLTDNITQGYTLMVAQSSMSVFHTGIIGTGLKKPLPEYKLPEFEAKLNTQYLLNALRSSCLMETNYVGLEAVSNLALSLVQLISTDVMFNGLPWPEEEFCKVTIERDLSIRRTLDTTPAIWAILEFVALQRPALCYCSVILRAVAATLMNQWGSASQGRPIHLKKTELENTTIKLLEIMALGQLLPAPLSSIQMIILHLQPTEVLLVFRECVWNYMRDHVPAPALFSRDGNGIMWRDPTLSTPSKQYIEPLRITILNNIDKLGSLYNQLFVNANEENE